MLSSVDYVMCISTIFLRHGKFLQGSSVTYQEIKKTVQYNHVAYVKTMEKKTENKMSWF